MARVTDDLRRVLEARNPTRVDIIVDAEPDRGEAVRDELRSLGLDFDEVNVRRKTVFSTTVTRPQLATLEQSEAIATLDHSPTFSPLGAAEPAPPVGEALPADDINRITLADAMDEMAVPEAWDELGNRGEGATVGIVDAPIDANHPMLREQVVDTASNAGRSLHGTWVASAAVGERWESGAGELYGAAPDADLYAHGALGGGGASITEIAEGIDYCIEQEVDVLNISFGGPHSDVLQSLIQEAVDAGLLVISSSGNSGPALGSSTCPAHHGNTVAVGSVGTDGSPAAFSGRGPGWTGESKPDMAAFGGNSILDDGQQLVTQSVLGAAPAGGAEYLVGTSMASPQAAGIAALGVVAGEGRWL